MPENNVHKNLSLDLHDWVVAHFKGDQIQKQLDATGSQETNPEKITTYIVDLEPLGDPEEESDIERDPIVISLVDHGDNTPEFTPIDQVHLIFPHEMVSGARSGSVELFGKIQKSLKDWAMHHQLGFDARDISVEPSARRKVPMAESRFSPLTGTVKTSVQTLENARLIIKHSDIINDDVRGARTRRIHRIYVENNSGERFLMPFNNLRGARAMARHVNEGGNPYDQRGQMISNLAEESIQLGRFVRRTRNQQFEDVVASDIIGSAAQRLSEVRALLHRVSGERGYQKHAPDLDQSPVMEYDQSVKSHFIRNQYDEQLDNSLPWAWRAYQMSKLQEVDQFRNWADTIVNEQDPTKDPKVKSIETLMGLNKPQDKEPEGIQVQKTAKGTIGITIPKDDAEAVNQATKFFGAGGPKKLPPKTTIDLVEREVRLTEAISGREIRIPIPPNMDDAHLGDLLASMRKRYRDLTLDYYENGQKIGVEEVDEMVHGDTGDRADDLIGDVRSAGQEELDADEPLSYGTGDKSYGERIPEAFEDDMEEGNAWTRQLAKTPKGGKFKIGGQVKTDTSDYDSEDVNEMSESLDRILYLSGIKK